jgi:hypothetical protein
MNVCVRSSLPLNTTIAKISSRQASMSLNCGHWTKILKWGLWLAISTNTEHTEHKPVEKPQSFMIKYIAYYYKFYYYY